MKRFWEIDFARGLAVAMMVLFNYAFAIRFFSIHTITESQFFWVVLPRIIGGAFIFIMGVSLAISYSRTRSDTFKKYTKRAAWIFSLGLIVTAATFLLMPEVGVVFGILHLIGASVFLAQPFLPRVRLALPAGFLIVVLGGVLSDASFNFNYLAWLGLRPAGFATLDYFPILPWFGIALIGLHFGDVLYRGTKRTFSIPELGKRSGISQLCFLGRHSLVIYMLHIPALVSALYALGFRLL